MYESIKPTGLRACTVKTVELHCKGAWQGKGPAKCLTFSYAKGRAPQYFMCSNR